MIITLVRKVDSNTLRNVYFAYAHSLMSYGIIFWGNSQHSERIFRLQKKLIRVMSNSGFREGCRPLFKKLNILTLPSLFIYKTLLFLQKNFEIFISKNHSHNYQTRNRNTLQYPIHRTSLFEKSPYYTAVRFYNCLPLHIKSELPNPSFKKVLYDYLNDKTFYRVADFVSNP